MTPTTRSIRQWIISVLMFDAIFWLFFVGSQCVGRAENCGDAMTFGVYLFYLPFSLISFPWLFGLQNQILLNVLSAITLIACHTALGALIGWLLRKKSLRWRVTIPLVFLLLVSLILGFERWTSQQEIARETYQQLWVIDDISDSVISYRVADWPASNAPETPWTIEDGEISLALQNTDRTVVKVLCFSPDCPSGMVDGHVIMTFEEYKKARAMCQIADNRLNGSCPYYNIGQLDLFDVTVDPLGIKTMVERYTQ